jgi:hypothetical protein
MGTTRQGCIVLNLWRPKVARRRATKSGVLKRTIFRSRAVAGRNIDIEAQDTPTSSVSDQLLASELVGNDKRFAQRLASILEFTQILFDDDENLTRVGNLSGVAKEKLQTRILEVFDMSPLVEISATNESLDDEDAADHDDEYDEDQE